MEAQLVEIKDIKVEYLELPEKAREIEEKCLDLIKSSEDNFKSVANKNMIRRIFSQISGGNIKSLAKGCKTMAEAQQLLVDVLKTHAMHTGKESYLLAKLANSVSEDAKRFNKAVETLNSHQKELLSLRKFHQKKAKEIKKLTSALVSQQKRLEELEGKFGNDPFDERYWNQELRLYLFAIMLFAAMADGEIVEEEIALIKQKNAALGLKGKYKEEAKWLLENRDALKSHQKHYLAQISLIPSYQIRLNIFQHALSVVLSDAQYTFREKLYIKKLTRTLNISKKDYTQLLNRTN